MLHYTYRKTYNTPRVYDFVLEFISPHYLHRVAHAALNYGNKLQQGWVSLKNLSVQYISGKQKNPETMDGNKGNNSCPEAISSCCDLLCHCTE